MEPSTDADPLATIEGALIALRRSMSRRTLGRVLVDEVGEGQVDLRLLEVLDAVDEGAGPDGDVTVGTVADRLALDPSRASRLVAEAVSGDLLRRVPSQRDARRAHLELTATGAELVARMGAVRRRHIATTVDDWTEAEIRDFATALARFTSRRDVPGGRAGRD